MHHIVVEPHADDAFLSLGGHIEKWVRGGDKVTIVTVFSDQKREDEARTYSSVVGASSVIVGLTESLMGGNTHPVVLDVLNDVVDRWILTCGTPSRILSPLGLQHPDHLSVRLTLAKRDCQRTIYFYLDTPYQYKRKLSDVLNEKCSGRAIDSILYPNARKWRHIPIFKSQAKFFHFNPMKGLEVPEIILQFQRDQ